MTNKFYAVFGLILNESGRILAVSRKNNFQDFGLPGGKVEKETVCQALIREVQEETGLLPLNFIMLHQTVESDLNRAYYWINKFSGNLSSKENGKIVWLTPNELLKDNCSFRESNRKFFEKITNLRSLP